jgi:ribosomal protein S18 acetylase RimI-like enzyme
MPRLRLVTPSHPAAAPLLAGLRHEYQTIYGADVAAELDAYSEYEFFPPAGAFLVLESGGMTLAGGALRRLEPGVGEIKRMWTAPAHRGRGYARRVLGALEAAAARRGYHTVRLQTGTSQPAAIGLYESSGYESVGPWGRYVDDPRLLSYEKRLDVRDDLATDELDHGEVIMRKMLEHHSLHTRLREAA